MDKDKAVEYEGTAIVLACSVDPSHVLFFPVDEENASVINYILKENSDDKKNLDINWDILGVYQTMLDSWTAGERFLSGVVIDMGYNKDEEDEDEEVISAKLFLSSIRTGRIEGLVKVNFVHAILLAAMEKIEVTVVDEILDKLIPNREDEDEDDLDDENLFDVKEKKSDKSDKPNQSNQPNSPNKSKKNAQYPVDKDILEIARKIMGGKIK
jgi:hypothetical protein